MEVGKESIGDRELIIVVKMHMEEQLSKIELRSEKVRNIISSEPPFWVRHGISIIAMILVVIAVVVYLLLPL